MKSNYVFQMTSHSLCAVGGALQAAAGTSRVQPEAQALAQETQRGSGS